jgi:Tol biopolymer transport system component
MVLKRGYGLAVAVLATFAAADGSYLEAVRGTDGAGRTVDDITAGKPAVVLLTSPRVAAVSKQLQLLRVLAEELGDAAAVCAAVYGEDRGTLAKFREGMPFPVVAGEGEVPSAVLGDEGTLPMALLVTRKGNVVRRYADVPGPLTVAEVLRVRYDPGPPRSPKAGELLPDLVLPASDGEFYNLRAVSLKKPRTLVFIFDAKDEKSRAALTPLQYLADDLGDDAEIVPIILGASDAVAAKLAEAENVDIPVLAGGPLAARRLAGKLELPVLIFTEAKGTVAGVKERAAVPTREEVIAEESAPAEEGEPVALAVTSVSRLSEGLQSDVVPTASFDAPGRYVVFCGRFGPGDVDHLYEVTISGKKLRQISMAAAPDVAPSCSPDGVHIAFVSGRSGGSEIWTCERVHGEFTQITKSDGAYAAPSYSLDGQWLVASRKVKTGGDENSDLWIMTARGRRERPIAETFHDEIEPAFSADGNRVFFASRRYGNWDVFSSDVKGGKRRRLTGPETDDRMPAPSPDGEYLVYASKAGDGPHKLWAMNVDGSSKVQLTSGEGDDLHPRFARDGGALVFVSSRTGSFEVYKIKFEPTPDYDLPRPARPLVTSERL